MECFPKLVLVTSLILLVLGFHALASCDMEELDALLEIKASINFPNGTALPHWTKLDDAGKLSDCCNDWPEIDCEGTGRVLSIGLSGVREVGDWYVNVSLFLPFQQLMVLDLSNNMITGWDRRLSDLLPLEALNLAKNKIKGMIDVHDLNNLGYVVLSNNSIDGFNRSHGKPSSPSNLAILELTYVNFNDADVFLDSLSFFPSLLSLYLKGNNFSGLNQSSGWLHQLKKIQDLDISACQLQGPFPSWLRNLTSLQALNLSQNNLYGVLPLFLENLTSLEYLQLSSNQFVGNLANSPLNKLTSLRVLFLSSNMFQIPNTFRSFFNHSSLKLLWLDGNSVIPDNETHQSPIPKFQLSHLSLSNCNLVAKLPDFLISQYSLTYLDLSNNYIEGAFPDWIVRNNTFLQLVTLHNNSIGSLHLSSHFHNHLSALDVSYNNINDYLPTTLGFFTALKILRLNNNNFSGLISSSLIPPTLRALEGQINHLEGQIPANICNLSFLNLENNHIAGSIPPCVNESNLEFVFLNNNKINGSLFPVLRRYTSLVILDVGNNDLSGVIPEWIGDLRNLSSLILSNNYFMSYIPTQICSLEKLSILDLSNNTLSGEIPKCLGQITFQPIEEKSFFVEPDIPLPMPTLIDDPLSEDYSYYSGQLGTFLIIKMAVDITTKSHTYTYGGKVLDGMSTTDLSCNNLSGHIPDEIGRMIGVRGLNLSHNNLIGSIPSTLSSLSQIESLDLSYNKLSGSIPPELTQLTTLEVFSVAHNNLSGRTPDEKAQFGTFNDSSYEGNPYLCGPPLLKDYCSTSPTSLPAEHQVVEDVDDSSDMNVFYISFTVSSVIMFVATLIVLYVNPYWRRVWFYHGELWMTCVYYSIVDSLGKAMRASVSFIWWLIYRG